MDQVDRAGDVRVDNVARLFEVLIEEALAKSMPSICEKRLDRPPLDRIDHLEPSFRDRG